MIKKMLISIMPKEILKLITSFKKVRYYKPILKILKKKTQKKRIILLGTPEHGNLGDHMIAEAELSFLYSHFPEYDVIEITGEHYRCQRSKIFNLIKDSDIIVITGGGFIGSLWLIEEVMVRDIIEYFTENKIVIFPSTIYYADNEFGKKEFSKSKEIYSKHENLSIFVRDEKSIMMAKKLLSYNIESRIIYTPDISFYLNKPQKPEKREGILLCLRNDKEKILSEKEIRAIIAFAMDNEIAIKKIDTVVQRQVIKEKRSTELQELLNEFSCSQLVITDRLHGMIMAALTETPCIALDNLSGKVKGGYDWIKDLNYIVFAMDLEEVLEAMESYNNIQETNYTNDVFLPKYSEIEKVLKD